jgi:cytochrome c-type biogenesis protein CcmE
VTVGLVLRALNENLNLFYPPAKVVSGEAPTGARIRAGGMVKEGSVQRATDSVEVRFVVTDYQGADFTVVYAGILPDLFREGKGIMVTGKLGPDRVFNAEEVLAKHDENYMPPELKGIGKQS